MNILRKKDGFTLIEAMIAITILIVGILGFFTLHSTSVVTNSRASTMTIATSLVAAQIETIRLQPYSTLVSSTPATEAVDPKTLSRTSWIVTDGTPVADAKSIVITVAVPNGGPPVSFNYVRHDDDT